MSWFKQVEPNDIVLASSYGDGIGRAEYSTKHILLLQHLSVDNPSQIFNATKFALAKFKIQSDLDCLKDRKKGQRKYVYCEYEQQGYYWQNQLGFAMSLISQFTNLYQMFTHPEVYSFMWSIHPSYRDNKTYFYLLQMLNPDLAEIPWAKYNKPLYIKSNKYKTGGTKEFHKYQFWVKETLFEKLVNRIDLSLIESMNLFNITSVRL